MHGLHYNHTQEFTEKKFKEWSKKAHKLKNNYNDIRDTHLKLYDSESYKLNIKEAKKIREKMIKDIKTHD